MEYNDSDQIVTVWVITSILPSTAIRANQPCSLDGAVSSRAIHHPERSFAFLGTMDLVKGTSFFEKKPPLHFHANQDEYIQAVEGAIGVEVEGEEIVLKPEHPEYLIAAWANHRSYPLETARQAPGCNVVRFLLSSEKTSDPFQLNTLFFENWYKYQNDIMKGNGKIDLVQVLSVRSSNNACRSLNQPI